MSHLVFFRLKSFSRRAWFNFPLTSVCWLFSRWTSSVCFLSRYFTISLESTLCWDSLVCWRSVMVFSLQRSSHCCCAEWFLQKNPVLLSVHGFLWVQRQNGSCDEESLHLQVRKTHSGEMGCTYIVVFYVTGQFAYTPAVPASHGLHRLAHVCQKAQNTHRETHKTLEV